MSQAPHESINVPSADIGTYTLLSLSPLFLPAPPIEIGNDQHPPQSTQKLAPHGTSDVVDGSGPIFSMYMEMATEEDKKMVENWKADADGILIFVSLSSNLMHHTDSMVIDWFILRCCCVVDLSVHPGHSTEPAGHLQFLPCKHLSGYCRPKSIQRFEFPPCFPTAVHSTKLCSLGERSLVLESGDQPYLCSSCDLVAAMGSKIPQGYSVALQSTQASTNSFILRQRSRELSPSVGSRNIAHASPHFPVLILCRLGCVSIKRQHNDSQAGVIMGRRLYGSLRMHHVDANPSS